MCVEKATLVLTVVAVHKTTPLDTSTCDTNGIKVCLPGYQNPQTNCVEEEGTTTEPLTTNNQADTETMDTNTEAAITDTNTEAAITDTNTKGSTVTTKHSSTSIVMVSTVPETTFTTQEFTSNSGVSPSAACANIVPIVAGGVAGGLVVLLIVNIVLVVGVLKFKFMKHYSNKQGMLWIIDVLKHDGRPSVSKNYSRISTNSLTLTVVCFLTIRVCNGEAHHYGGESSVRDDGRWTQQT